MSNILQQQYQDDYENIDRQDYHGSFEMAVPQIEQTVVHVISVTLKRGSPIYDPDCKYPQRVK